MLAFAELDSRQQTLVIRRLDWIIKIQNAPRSERAAVVAQAAAALKVSCPTIYRIVREYLTEGWGALTDQRGSRSNRGLPQAFVDFVRQRHLQCQRSNTGREVHRQIIEQWRLWMRTGDFKHAIPGYAAPPPAGPSGNPAGWSVDTFRRLRPDSYALAVTRQGGKRAASFLPSILKTRVGSRFGAVVFFDDQDYDLKIAPRGMGQRALRPQGFNCLDYLSGAFLNHAIRLRWWDQAEDQYRTLTQQDFTWFVISFLQKHGYRTDSTGTTLVFEHGTATGYNNKALATAGGFSSFDDALAAVSYGCIRVDRSGLFNQPAFAGMLFRPQSSGNPNFKAPLESLFNLVRNRMAALPGATGRNRDLKPAEQYGQDQYTGQMLKLWDRLDERHREWIRFPVLTAEQFGEIAARVYDAINARTDHALEGWEQCGFVATQMRFTPDERSPWLSQSEVADLPESSRIALLSNMENRGHVRTARLSPAEVARACAGELTRLPDHAIPLLIPSQWARPVTVKQDRTISIKDQMLGPEAFQYIARIEDADGARVLKPGVKLLAFLNPFAPARLVVCREDGAFVGTLQQMTRCGFTDADGILGQLKARAEMKADLDTGIRPHLAGLIEERAEMKRINERLAKGLPVLPDDVAEARSEAARQGQRTAAANRLKTHGGPVDWDAESTPAAESSAWDELPADDELPEAL
jgi:hypothetical protein